MLRLRRIAGAAGKIDHHRHAQLLRQPNGLAADVLIVPGAVAIRMQRIAVAAQRADGETVIRQRLLERVERGAVVQHRQLAVRVAGIIARAQFHGGDVMRRKLFQNVAEREAATAAG